MRRTVTIACIAVALGLAGLSLVAFADDGSGSAAAITAPATGSAATAAPSDQLHDPLSAPAAAFDDLKAARKIGWPLAILAALVITAKLLSRLGGVWSKLGTGHAALAIGALSAGSCAAYNALALGGSWMAVGLALIVALAAALDVKGKPKASDAPASSN